MCQKTTGIANCERATEAMKFFFFDPALTVAVTDGTPDSSDIWGKKGSEN